GGVRFVVAGLVLLVAVLVLAGRGALRMNRKQLGSALLIGLLLPAWGNGMVVIAEQHVASGLAALLIASVPLYVVVLRRLLGERLDLGAVTTQSWLAWSYLILFGSLLAFSSYVFVLGKLPVSTVATYAYVNPVIAVVLGVLFANEHFGFAQFAGGLVVLCAVV